MRSLYLKIFLASWLMMLLVVGCNMLVTWTLARQFEDSEGRTQTLSSYASQAMEQFATGGPMGLQRWREQLKLKTGLKVVLLDDRGLSLTGEPLPPWLLDKLFRFGRQPMQSEDAESCTDDDDHDHDRHSNEYRRGDDDHKYRKDKRDWIGRDDWKDKRFPRFRPAVLPMQYNGQRYLFVVMNPRELLEHLYSGPQLAWRIGLTLLLVGLLSFLMARYLISPIRQLQRTSQKLAEGQLDSRVGDTVSGRKDELGQLGQDFDRMAERIQSLVQGQQQLLRDVSHELRTPLARQRVALELARKQLGEDASLDRIEKQAEQLDQLIDEILMLARLDARAETEPKTPIDLDQLLQELTEEFNLDQARVDYRSDGAVSLAIEPRLIRRAVANGLSNALKYSQDQVELSLSIGDNDILIQIADRGPGIEPEMLEKIFEPFVRTDKARSRQQGGWGLGLAIAARAVAQHQGRISARNRDDGGLILAIQLPRQSS
ncbi:HAMP domain-containing protein [Motiliproteus coralliicola]|uniref:histidine kinase n=1 Tax=Motiliproteus coralliicola TaxID=2283196 RepID=A0A369WC57_9GAMM|nr:ATP-binding protein [Motiliproteus coralliicola]RDE18206.1 HAMP domain-containing protein [Motiliproteus coralliicola]